MEEKNKNILPKDDQKDQKEKTAKTAARSEKEYQELENKYKRALADYQNLLKQTVREKEEFFQYANERLIGEILPVYDNLKVSLRHLDEAAEKNGWAEGIKHVIKQFENVLKDFFVEEIETAGKEFDHNTMEAVEREKAEDEKMAGLVAKVLSAGYKLNGKVIRAARVVVYE